MVNSNLFIPFKGIQIKGIQNIHFGMSRTKIREIMGDAYQNFRRGAAENTTDLYKDKGLFFEYDKDDLCNAIGFANYSNLFIESENILKYSYSELTNLYSKKSLKKDIEGDKSIIFLDLGFGISKIDNTDKIESVIVFSDDYW
jgi:hypothetical protein